MQLRIRPCVISAFHGVGLGIKRGVEATVLVRHLPQREVENTFGDGTVVGLVGKRVKLRIGTPQQRLIVEHLLEMRDVPLCIGGVAMEPAADMVVYPSLCHFLQRAARHLQARVVVGQAVGLEQEQQCVLIGELRSLVKPAQPVVVVIAEMADQRLHQLAAGKRAALGIVFLLFDLDDGASQPLGLRFKGYLILRPYVVDLLNERREGRRREIGAGVKRLEIGRDEYVVRPAAAVRHQLGGHHVEFIHVRALLPVDLDADDRLVHQFGDLGILEDLPFHYMAPVAGGIADGEQNRLVFLPRLGKRFLAPWIPVNRVMRVLEQIRTARINKLICISMRRKRKSHNPSEYEN